MALRFCRSLAYRCPIYSGILFGSEYPLERSCFGAVVFALGWYICLGGKIMKKSKSKREIALPPPENLLW
jgi:hypothetical protein